MPKEPKASGQGRRPKPAKKRAPRGPHVPRVPPAPPMPIVEALCLDTASAVLKLLTDGVTVFPVLDADQVRMFRTELNEATKAFPEFRREYVKGGALFSDARFSGGSFGCLGSPASNHCKVIRRLRQVIYTAYLPILEALEAHPSLRHLFPGLGLDGAATFIEYIVDRFCVRHSLSQKESWHIDDSPSADAADAIFGGWLNLGPDKQFFVCQLGSHLEYRDPLRKVGFTPIRDPVRRAELNATGVKVRIPVGNAIVFFQVITHAVNPDIRKPGTLPSVRLYFGARLSNDDQPLGGKEELMRAFTDMAPVRVKSNQEADMYPVMYSITKSGMRILEDWSRDAIADLPGLKETVTVTTTGYVYERVKKHCPSYRELGILSAIEELCPPYTDMERAMHLPVRARAREPRANAKELEALP